MGDGEGRSGQVKKSSRASQGSITWKVDAGEQREGERGTTKEEAGEKQRR
jgi:hypothetical protein